MLFQLVNPKGWALMVTVSAAAHCAGSGEALPVLLLIVIPAASLLAWHLLSVGAPRLLAADMGSPAVQRAAGVALIVSAFSLRGI
jgi:threonine/homoserine/homoserine lactone efflux protein